MLTLPALASTGFLRHCGPNIPVTRVSLPHHICSLRVVISFGRLGGKHQVSRSPHVLFPHLELWWFLTPQHQRVRDIHIQHRWIFHHLYLICQCIHNFCILDALYLGLTLITTFPCFAAKYSIFRIKSPQLAFLDSTVQSFLSWLSVLKKPPCFFIIFYMAPTHHPRNI